MGRFLNESNTSKDANIQCVKMLYSGSNSRKELGLFFVTTKMIKEGEELRWDYRLFQKI